MADPFAILASARPDTGSLLQTYNGLQRQRLQDMYTQAAFERQQKQDTRVDAENAREDAARAAIARGAKPEEVIGIDPTTGFQYATHAAQIAKAQRDAQGERAHAVGNAAMFVSRLPATEQPQAWDQAIDHLVSQGYTDLSQYKGHYDPKALPALIAASEEASKAYLAESDKDRDYAETVRAHRAGEATAAGNLKVAQGGLGLRQKAEARITKWGPQPLIGVMPTGDGSDLDAKYGGK